MRSKRMGNLFQTMLQLAGMFFLLGGLGYSLGGWTGLVWAGLLGVGFLLVSQRFSSRLVLRMLNARPLSTAEVPELYEVVRELARRARLPKLPDLYLLPGQATNALTVGKRNAPAIGVTEPLLRRLTGRELVGVMAHEISHIRNNDLRVLRIADTLGRITRMFSFVGQVLLFFNLPFLLMGRPLISWYAILLLIAAPTVSVLLQLALSRTREFEADLGAVELTGDPQGLASALQKLEYYQASLLRRLVPTVYRLPNASIFRTHPDTDQRIERLLSLPSGHPDGIIHIGREPILQPQVPAMSRLLASWLARGFWI